MLLILIILYLLIFSILSYPFIEIVRGKIKKQTFPLLTTIFNTPISIIISVFNEEKYIQTKIEEILNENIWIKGSELIIVSGGSTDKTNEILSNYSENTKIKIVIKKESFLKIESINLAVEMAKNEYLVFSDCRQKMEKGSIPLLVNTLISEKAGAVTGTLVNLKNGKPHQSFRKWLNTMNIMKAKNGSSMNVYGALYSINKSNYKPIPTDIIFDDLFVLASILSQRKKIIQVEKAIFYEVNFETYYQEERIQRLTRGLLLFFVNHFKLIKQMPFRYKFHFLMSKYSKLTLPILFFTAVLLNITYLLLTQQNRFFLPVMALTCITCTLSYIFISVFRLSIKLIVFTLKSQYLFFFKNKRSVRWEKLKH